MRNLKAFHNAQAVGNGVKVKKPNVSYLRGKNVIYSKGKGEITVIVNSQGKIEYSSYASEYLTFEATQSGTFKFSGATSTHTLSYSLDDGATWTTLAHNTNTPTIAAGSKIMWKGALTPQSNKGIGKFSATGNFNAYGNTMSLLYGDNFVGQTDLTDKDYVFYKLFDNNTKIVNTQNLILPATTLASRCYQDMFWGCTNLTTAPLLPAAILVDMCYNGMFYNCTSLNYLKMLCGNSDEATLIYDNSYRSGSLYIYDSQLAVNDTFLNQFIGWDLYYNDQYQGVIVPPAPTCCCSSCCGSCCAACCATCCGAVGCCGG